MMFAEKRQEEYRPGVFGSNGVRGSKLVPGVSGALKGCISCRPAGVTVRTGTTLAGLKQNC